MGSLLLSLKVSSLNPVNTDHHLCWLPLYVFEDDPILCVIQAIMDYQERFKPWRRNDICKNQFLLNFVEPHKPAVS